MMNFLITIGLLWLFFIFPIWMFIDCIRSPVRRLMGKVAWGIVILFIPILGAIIYGFIFSNTKGGRWLSVVSLILIVLGGYRLHTFSTRFPGFRPSDVKDLQEISGKKLNQIPVTDTDVSNAASGYFRAQKLMKYPESIEVRDRFRKIAEEGLGREDSEARRILADNEASLAEVVRAAYLEHCDFYFGTYEEGRLNEVPKYPHTVFFSHLSLLKARQLENQKKYDQAVGYFLIPLRMASQIGSNPEIISGAIATAISGTTIRSLRHYINTNPELKREDLHRIESALAEFSVRLYQPTRFVEDEKTNILVILNLLIETPNDVEWTDAEQPRGITLQSQEIRKRARELVNEIYDPFIRAAKTNNENEWENARRNADRFKRYPQIVSKGVFNSVYAGLRWDEEGYVKAYVDPALKIILSVAVPDLRKLVAKHHELLNELEGLRDDVGNRLRGV